jgi:peptide/nickel transport system substrate-binding protein
MRRAIMLSIDVASLTRAATHGAATADSSPVPAVSPYFGPAQRAIVRRDVAQARALARAAGYKGQTIKLVVSRAPPEMFDAAIIIQAMAREAGIRMEIVNMDWASHLQRYQRGDYQATVFAFSPRMDPSWLYGLLIGDKDEEPRKVWDTPRARALLDQSMAAAAPAARQAAFDALETEFRRDAPAVVLFNTKRVTALGPGVTGYASWPAQLQRLWGVAKAR